jgi:hypothetical protein
MNPVVAPWMAQCVIMTVRSVRKDHRPPLPSEFVATFIIFGSASLLATRVPQVPALFCWGIVIASTLNLWNIDGTLKQPLGALPEGQTTAGAANRARQTQRAGAPNVGGFGGAGSSGSW